ncbi:hypothetical protein LCM02_00630 [Lutimonas saemankumensis]|uniref:hypothetical protein n=1 Tax=Lutimonas saemankumensis TaxID=483016 RepID=UPI001CD75A0E|nr:hypothetical protein [Lutimonas saemankumensis]MCA0930933.1 hypothetical protein [Lutimonas saemankumensis]
MDPNQGSNGSNQVNNKEEDVDISQLFLVIGKGISQLVNALIHMVRTIFHWILTFLLYIRLNLKKMILAALIGGSLGAIYQYGLKDVQYESSMTVEPNFGSSVQLYKNAEFYLNLIKQEDFSRLASALGISEEGAKSISWIEVEPYMNENDVILSYKNFVSELDSNSVKLVDFKSFSKKQPVESFKYHIITITAKDKFIFQKLEKPIISSVNTNEYYAKVKSTTYDNLISKKVALENSMNELDSLRNLYKKVLLAESSKENSGTNIFMSETGNTTKEVDVFDKYMVMNEELIDVNIKLTSEKEVVNVVSGFNSVGMKVNYWYRNFAVIGFIAGFSLMFLLIGFRRLDKELMAYKKSV